MWYVSNRKYTRHCNIPEKKGWLHDLCQANTMNQFIFSSRRLIGMGLMVKWINWIGMFVSISDAFQHSSERKKNVCDHCSYASMIKRESGWGAGGPYPQSQAFPSQLWNAHLQLVALGQKSGLESGAIMCPWSCSAFPRLNFLKSCLYVLSPFPPLPLIPWPQQFVFCPLFYKKQSSPRQLMTSLTII